MISSLNLPLSSAGPYHFVILFIVEQLMTFKPCGTHNKSKFLKTCSQATLRSGIYI